ncbi:MAG TPA: hypothetical protein VL022_10755 [Moheibacter sp.]|nr:hypothetical protein [Moheibacter sp.]
MTKKQNSIFVIALSILIALFILKMWNDLKMFEESEKDYFLKQLSSKSIKGVRTDIKFSKGGFTVLTIKDTVFSRKNVSVDASFRYDVDIKKGNMFEKRSNSNKCIYIMNDSVYYFDCFKIPKEIRDSLGEIQEWPRDIVGKWTLK